MRGRPEILSRGFEKETAICRADDGQNDQSCPHNGQKKQGSKKLLTHDAQEVGIVACGWSQLGETASFSDGCCESVLECLTIESLIMRSDTFVGRAT